MSIAGMVADRQGKGLSIWSLLEEHKQLETTVIRCKWASTWTEVMTRDTEA